MRLFVAVDLPGDVKAALEGLRHEVRGFRWVGNEQLHLTMRFIGESELEVIGEALASVQGHAFTASIGGGGSFPVKSKKPYVLWVGMKAPELGALRAGIDAALEGLVEPEEKPFHPHVTLARLKDADPRDVGRAIAAINALGERTFRVSTFRLYESHLGPKGASYEVQREYALTT